MFRVIRNAPGGKGGRCVWLTTYHHYSADVMKTRSLNSPGPLRAYVACSGTTLPFLLRSYGSLRVQLRYYLTKSIITERITVKYEFYCGLKQEI